MSLRSCTVFAICQMGSDMSLLKGKGQFPIHFIQHWLWRWQLSLFFGSFHRPIPVRWNWIVFARKMHSTTKFAMTVLSKCVCLSVSLSVCPSVCVCVWTIWKDVKLLSVDFVALLVCFLTLHDLFSNFNFSRRGAQKAHRAVPNEALYGVLRISRLITWTYLHPIFNSFDVTFPKWRPAKPTTGMSNVKPKFDFACTVFAIWFTADFVRWNSCL